MTRRIPHAKTEVRQAFQKLTKRSDVLTTGTAGQVLIGQGIGVIPVWTTDLTALTSLTVDNITIDAATILSDSGAISFGNENLTTTGTIAGINVTSGDAPGHTHSDIIATDKLVAVDSGATAGYLGAAAGDGVLRASTGISYADGGDFVTLALSHLGIESLTDPGADRIMFWDDVGAAAVTWLVVSTGLQISTTNLVTNDNEIVHANLSGYVANEHIDHTTVTLTAGSGITGGGDISVNRTLDLDINSLAAASIAAGDFVPFWDITATATNKKITFANFEGTIDHGSIMGLGDDDHTIYLLADGSRDLTGNLAVDSGITIDGRDISSDGATLDTIQWLTVGTGLDLTGTTLSTEDSEIVHDDLSGFAANEHFLQTAIANVSTALATGLLKVTTGTGALTVVTDSSANWNTAFGWGDHGVAGYISATLTQEEVEDYAGTLVANATGTHTGIAITYQDATGDIDFVVDHDAATNFVANEHIDHTGVTLTAGSGIAGGGDISANRSFDLDINSLAAAVIVAGDYVPFWDITATATNKKILFSGFEAALAHDNLSGYAANEHIDWTNASDDFLTSGNVTCRNSGSDIATLGSELLTNGAFASDLSSWTIGDAGAEWVWDATGKADHATGNTSTFYQGISLTNTETYYVEFTVSGHTAGSVVLTFGALVGSYTASTNGTYQYSFRTTSTASFNLTFTPTSTFDGMLDDVTVKQITGTSGSIVTLEDNTGANAIEIRASFALQNTFIGLDCGHYNIVGNYNTAIGYYAFYNNTTGQNNFAVGTEASYSNTTGDNNVAVGYRALYLGTIANYNTAIGSKTLRYDTTGSRNVAIGYQALYSNTISIENTAIGFSALQANTEGDYNLAIGSRALYNNTTANQNVAVGYYTLFTNTLGYNNTAIGGSALEANTEGFENTAIGYRALVNVTTGDKNTAVGRGTAAGITTGNSNTIIGAWVTGLATTLSNHIILADGDGNQRVIVDDAGVLMVSDAFGGLEKSTDPAEPAEGEFVIWMSDGTGKGDDGDVMIASQAAGQTNVGTLFDHSGGAAW